MRLGTKPPMSCTVTDEIATRLDAISKAALIDLYVQSLATSLGACDTPPSMSDLADDVRPMLEMRGDPIPAWAR